MAKKAILFWFLTISLLDISCKFSERSNEPVNEIKTKAFDTTFNFSGLGIPIDTLEVTYMAYACDCPQYLTDSDRVRQKRLEGSQGIPNGYYIEPTDLLVQIPDALGCPGNRYRLYGYVRTTRGLPDEDIFITDNPPLGKVFCYFSWEVIKPYCIYQQNGEKSCSGK